MSTYKELLMTSREILRGQDIADADIDAWYLLSFVFGINRTEYVLRQDEAVSEADYNRTLELIKKRAEHIPLQYITRSQEFMGLEFEVTEEVLIPRQDTELLVEEVLKFCSNKSVLDLCTGSGCIIISLAKLSNPVKSTAVDISEGAIALASRNAHRHGVQVEFLQGDLYEPVEDRYDIIVSNPPYIPTKDIKELMPEVREHEPIIALDGREDGLDFYRRIIANAKEHLREKGMIFFEIGYNQGEAVKQLFLDAGFKDVLIKKDLSGLNRVVSARL